jgi:hypothetical protein
MTLASCLTSTRPLPPIQFRGLLCGPVRTERWLVLCRGPRPGEMGLWALRYDVEVILSWMGYNRIHANVVGPAWPQYNVRL